MARTAILAIRIISDARNAAQGFDQAATGVDKFKSGLSAANGVAMGIVASMAAVGAAAVKTASEAQQAAGAVESVFGAAASTVKSFAAEAANTVGLAAQDYNQLAAVLGAQLKNLGVAQGEMAGQTDELIRLGADLAATFGGTTADAVAALSSLFRGETDPIERYGVSIKQADISARLAAQGMSGLTGAARTQAETQARLAILTEQTAAAQGQFGREANTAAGQQERMNAQFKDAKAAIGEGLLPVLSDVAEKLASVAEWISQNQTAFKTIIGVVGGFAAVIITLNAAMSAYATISGVVAAVKAIETAAWTANAVAVWAATWPILLIIAIIAAVIAIVILVVKNLDTLRGWWDIAFAAGKAAAQWVWDKLKQLASWISGAFRSAVDGIGRMFTRAKDAATRALELMLAPIKWVIDKVRELIDWISRISFPDIGGWIGGVFGGGDDNARMAPQTMGLMSARSAVPQPMMAAATSTGPTNSLTAAIRKLSSAPAQTVVNVTVTGAVDPVETGKQIRKALENTEKSLGGSQAVRLSGRGELRNHRAR